MSLRKELDRLKTAVRKREERQGNLLIATITDASPHQQYGYVVARLVDGTLVNVRAWSPVQLSNGQQIIIVPMGRQTWNWYALLQVNASTDVESTPYTPAPLSSTVLPQHGLDSAAHTGTLPWSKVDTSVSKVELASQVSGVLPLAFQARETSLRNIVITTGSVGGGATGSGSVDGPKLAYVRKVEVSGSQACKIRFYETASGQIEYETETITPPFLDQGGWMHLESSGQAKIHWEVTNMGSASDTYTIILQVIAWEV